jgi:hypothetical protein
MIPMKDQIGIMKRVPTIQDVAPSFMHMLPLALTALALNRIGVLKVRKKRTLAEKAPRNHRTRAKTDSR